MNDLILTLNDIVDLGYELDITEDSCTIYLGDYKFGVWEDTGNPIKYKMIIEVSEYDFITNIKNCIIKFEEYFNNL